MVSPAPPFAVQVKVPASPVVRLVVVTFCVTSLSRKHDVHPVFHVKVVEDVGGGTVAHVRVTLLNMG